MPCDILCPWTVDSRGSQCLSLAPCLCLRALSYARSIAKSPSDPGPAQNHLKTVQSETLLPFGKLRLGRGHLTAGAGRLGGGQQIWVGEFYGILAALLILNYSPLMPAADAVKMRSAV